MRKVNDERKYHVHYVTEITLNDQIEYKDRLLIIEVNEFDGEKI